MDDRQIVSGILFVIRSGLRWRDAPAAYLEQYPGLGVEAGVTLWCCATLRPGIGITICKDMHFPSRCRDHARRNARLMLAPAGDFDADDWPLARFVAALIAAAVPFGRFLRHSRAVRTLDRLAGGVFRRVRFQARNLDGARRALVLPR